MKANELWMRCFKARVVSWLNSDRVGATVPLGDGQHILLAIYENGRYLKPESVEVPNSIPAGWGPDGPINLTPVDTDDEEEDDDDDPE